MKRLPLLALALLLTVVGQSSAAICYAVTSSNRLITFDSATPGTVTNDVPISGLDVSYSIVGIDIRTTMQSTNAHNPGLGSLWGIAYNGTNFQLCVINPTTGVAAPVGSFLVGLDDSASANGFSFGFDPSRDRFQFISVQYNYEIDPNTATYVQKTSFPGFPAWSGAGFTTTSFGGTNRFYNVSRDVSPRVLQTSTNVNSGVVTVVPGGNNLGMNIGTPVGMDIEGSQALIATEGSLSVINLSAGTLSSTTAIMGMPDIRGLAIKPTSFPPQLSVTAKISGPKKVTTTKSSRLIKGTAKSGAGIKLVEYKVGKAKFKKAKGTTKWKFTAKLKPGKNVISVRATGGNDVQSKIVKVTVTRE